MARMVRAPSGSSHLSGAIEDGEKICRRKESALFVAQKIVVGEAMSFVQ